MYIKKIKDVQKTRIERIEILRMISRWLLLLTFVLTLLIQRFHAVNTDSMADQSDLTNEQLSSMTNENLDFIKRNKYPNFYLSPLWLSRRTRNSRLFGKPLWISRTGR